MNLLENDVAVLKEKEKKFSELPVIKKKIQEADKIENKQKELQIKWVKIEKTLVGLDSARNDIEKLSEIEKVKENCELLIEIRNTIEENEFINSVINDYNETIKRRVKISDIIKEVKKLIVKYEKCINTLSKKNSQLLTSKQYAKASEDTKELSESLRKYTTQYSTLLKKNKMCPYCFSKIDIRKIDKIVKENI